LSTLNVNTIGERTSGNGVQITGHIIQVVSATDAASSNGDATPRYGIQKTSNSFEDTGLSASITPKATSSKILIIVRHNPLTYAPGTIPFAHYQLLRGSTVLTGPAASGHKADDHPSDNNAYNTIPIVFNYLDSPSTTSATTYKTQASYVGSSSGYTWTGYYALSTMTLMEVGG